MTTRVLTVFGSASADSVVKLWINDQYQGEGPIDFSQRDPFEPEKIMIYRFESDVQSHGFTKIKLEIIKGQISVGRTKYRYPAKMAGQEHIQGYHWGFQPMPDPKFLVSINGELFVKSVEDQALTGEWHYDLKDSDQFEYAHLHFNGPNYAVVSVAPDKIEEFQYPGVFGNEVGFFWNYQYLAHSSYELDRIKMLAIEGMDINREEIEL